MKAFPYEQKAANLEPMPDGLEYFDQCMYLNLRNVYAALRGNLIDRDEAMHEKIELIEAAEHFQYKCNMEKIFADAVVDTQQAREEYRKHRTLENADKLLHAFEGL